MTATSIPSQEVIKRAASLRETLDSAMAAQDDARARLRAAVASAMVVHSSDDDNNR